MYVCICNAFTEKDVHRVIASGEVRSVGCVYRLCGGRPKCGKCVGVVRQMVAGAACGCEPATCREAGITLAG
ncbi:MAG: hypothetical protein EA405_00150 [Rhodospirillales bacterium]|nr:MAG: hypothetical protein EA405_00150 [Rhodospirillales bacterium]